MSEEKACSVCNLDTGGQGADIMTGYIQYRCTDCRRVFLVSDDAQPHMDGCPPDPEGLSCPWCDGWAFPENEEDQKALTRVLARSIEAMEAALERIDSLEKELGKVKSEVETLRRAMKHSSLTKKGAL